MPFLQLVSGKYRVRIVVPPELRPHLPPPHTGKANLTRALGTGMLFTYAFDNEHITTNPMARSGSTKSSSMAIVCVRGSIAAQCAC